MGQKFNSGSVLTHITVTTSILIMICHSVNNTGVTPHSSCVGLCLCFCPVSLGLCSRSVIDCDCNSMLFVTVIAVMIMIIITITTTIIIMIDCSYDYDNCDNYVDCYVG